MREIKSHIVEGDSANHQLKIEVLDEPGDGGACHAYQIGGFNTETNRSAMGGHYYGETIFFQNGPIPQVGVNGVTQESLLAIIIDRLEGFQRGKFASVYNESALQHCKDALAALQARTSERISRQVEGTHAI